ncbi:reverse transcriptase domain-containing protein [Tanacetum coccineum]
MANNYSAELLRSPTEGNNVEDQKGGRMGVVLILTISVSPPMATLSRNIGIIYKDTLQQQRVTTISSMQAHSHLRSSLNLMPLLMWKKLGLPKLISTQMTLELVNRAICTPEGIARDVFVPVGKFTFSVDFVIVDYESDPRVPLILGRPFLQDRTEALIDFHGKGEEDDSLQDGGIAEDIALITFPSGNDDLPFDAESDLRELEYLLNHDPIKEMDSILKDSVDKNSLDDNLVDTISK